ncbi:2-hydroxyacid dehydrogenase [Paracoccus sp. p4-l81]|uniref:2-hydroxyacid dehydrogenase n=1 Tax=Paracoccus sp. p4-l81 TaxID=3342806 RepID=UPI0035B9B831
MATILFAAPDRLWPDWAPHLRAALPGHDLLTDADPASIDVILYAPNGGLVDFSPFTRCRLVQSLWAGVERITGNASLTQPLARMVDPGLAQGMVEYVTGHVLRVHLGIDAYAQDGVWRNDLVPPLASERRVTVLGLGELGGACARALSGLGFAVTGWSRRPAALPGIRCLSGTEGLEAALTGAQIVITLLPLTPTTENLMDAARLARLAPGAHLINPGRGALIDDKALVAALDRGDLGGATLDVFRVEPLPADHPFWGHPKVLVTPHIAAETRPATAAQVVAENVARVMAGQPPRFLVDRGAGY